MRSYKLLILTSALVGLLPQASYSQLSINPYPAGAPPEEELELPVTTEGFDDMPNAGVSSDQTMPAPEIIVNAPPNQPKVNALAGVQIPQPGSAYFDAPEEAVTNEEEMSWQEELPLEPDSAVLMAPRLPEPTIENKQADEASYTYIESAPPPPPMDPQDFMQPELEVYASDYVDLDQEIVVDPMRSERNQAAEGLQTVAFEDMEVPVSDVSVTSEKPEVYETLPMSDSVNDPVSKVQPEPETIVFEGPRVIMMPPEGVLAAASGSELAEVNSTSDQASAVQDTYVMDEFSTAPTEDVSIPDQVILTDVSVADAPVNIPAHPRAGLVYIQDGEVIQGGDAVPITKEYSDASYLAAAQSTHNPGDWMAQNGASVQDTLQLWSKLSDAEFIWDLQGDFIVRESLSLTGSFEAAVQSLLDQYIEDSRRPVAKLFIDTASGKRVLAVMEAD